MRRRLEEGLLLQCSAGSSRCLGDKVSDVALRSAGPNFNQTQMSEAVWIKGWAGQIPSSCKLCVHGPETLPLLRSQMLPASSASL